MEKWDTETGQSSIPSDHPLEMHLIFHPIAANASVSSAGMICDVKEGREGGLENALAGDPAIACSSNVRGQQDKQGDAGEWVTSKTNDIAKEVLKMPLELFPQAMTKKHVENAFFDQDRQTKSLQDW